MENSSNSNNNKVMTDEQRETLRMQIALYHYICGMLADMNEFRLSLEPLFSEVTVETEKPKEPFKLEGGGKWSKRKRWSANPVQIMILEYIFKERGQSHPSKQKIKEIAAVLSQHGEVSETNVYYWFQNRLAREKKMQKNVQELAYNNNNNNNNNNN